VVHWNQDFQQMTFDDFVPGMMLIFNDVTSHLVVGVMKRVHVVELTVLRHNSVTGDFMSHVEAAARLTPVREDARKYQPRLSVL
jgi:hypothetical protein